MKIGKYRLFERWRGQHGIRYVLLAKVVFVNMLTPVPLVYWFREKPWPSVPGSSRESDLLWKEVKAWRKAHGMQT